MQNESQLIDTGIKIMAWLRKNVMQMTKIIILPHNKIYCSSNKFSNFSSGSITNNNSNNSCNRCFTGTSRLISPWILRINSILDKSQMCHLGHPSRPQTAKTQHTLDRINRIIGRKKDTTIVTRKNTRWWALCTVGRALINRRDQW